MKIGFSSLVCPSWDLATILSKAAEYEFEGVELRGLQGKLDLPNIPELAGHPSAVRARFASAGVELVCLSSSCSFSSRDKKESARQRAELNAYLELAGELGCPFVRVFAGDVQTGEARQNTLSRVAEELRKVTSYALDRGVTILIQNAGDFSGSADLWYLADAVSHPAICVCWDPCAAMTVPERPTTSIPRLGMKIGLVHICDAEFDAHGFMVGGYRVPGEGNVELSRAIELLRGVFYQDYLIFEWPRLWQKDLARPDDVLPKVRAYLSAQVEARQPILTAYKGDKNPPKYKPLPTVPGARPVK
jgi:sugar phosphate isomerase/epimerase